MPGKYLGTIYVRYVLNIYQCKDESRVYIDAVCINTQHVHILV